MTRTTTPIFPRPIPGEAPVVATPPSHTRRFLVAARVALVLAAVALGYAANERLRPPTPREVVDRCDRAATPDKAAKVASRRFAPIARAAVADPAWNPTAG